MMDVPSSIELSDVERHASFLSNFILMNSLYIGVNIIIKIQKLGGNLDTMTVANLGRQHHGFWDSYFKSA